MYLYLLYIVTVSLDGNVFSNNGENSIIALAKLQSVYTITRDKSISSQIQIITLPSAFDGTNNQNFNNNDSGERRILNSLQQYTKNFYTPLVRFAGQAVLQDISNSSTNPSQNSSNANGTGNTTNSLGLKSSNVTEAIGSTNSTINEADLENINLLQKKVRELDIVLEQCQRGAIIPSINLNLHPSLLIYANKANAIQIKTLLEKYNISQVDLYFQEIGLIDVIGATQDTKEEYANELNKSAKLWPIEIAKQTKLIESNFPGNIEKGR